MATAIRGPSWSRFPAPGHLANLEAPHPVLPRRSPGFWPAPAPSLRAGLPPDRRVRHGQICLADAGAVPRLDGTRCRCLPPGGFSRRLTATPDFPAARIRVRRFAGPAAYVGALSPPADRAPHRPPRRPGDALPGPARSGGPGQRREARPGGDHGRLRLPQPALPGPADRAHARVHGAGAGRAGQPRLLGRRRRGPRTRSLRGGRRGAAQPAHHRHPAATSSCRCVGLDDAYTGHARRDEAVKGLRKDMPDPGAVPHRRGGRRPVAARRPAGAGRPHPRRPGHLRPPARDRGRQASPATSTSTACTARARHRRPRSRRTQAARSTSAPASAPR